MMARGSEQSGMANSASPGARSMSWRGSAVMAPPRSPIRSARRRAAARVLGDLGEFVAEQVDCHAFETVGDRVRPQTCHDVVAVEAVEIVDHILGRDVWAGHGFPFGVWLPARAVCPSPAGAVLGCGRGLVDRCAGRVWIWLSCAGAAVSASPAVGVAGWAGRNRAARTAPA